MPESIHISNGSNTSGVFKQCTRTDMGHAEHKKQVLKEAVCGKIRKELGISKDDVAVLQKKLRKYYKTQKDKKASGTVAMLQEKRVHYDGMKFLDASIDV
uniref:Uncharacterized protein n=1 Tax=Ditylenchus dipsaci TaxID=166011 RepID=A0A915ESN1_9BILA